MVFSNLKRSIQAQLDSRAEAQAARAGLVIAGERIKAAEARATSAEGQLLALAYDPDEHDEETRVVLDMRPC